MPLRDEAEAIVRALGLVPHPEGGHYREIFRDHGAGGARGAVTAIYYLLKAGERSHWHRIDAVEIWHFHAGAALSLALSAEGGTPFSHKLGNDLLAGERPQIAVPARVWQSAATLGAYSLVGCTVAPAFSFAGFELAPPGWEPG